MKRSHRGIALTEGSPDAKALAASRRRDACPLDPDPRRKVCRACDRRVMYVRKSYGPNGKAGHWKHVGDGLGQYRSWGVTR
jgi:hypothetical protein